MPGPSTLTINLIPNAVANVISVSISPALQSLDSSTPGGQQTGFSSVDLSVRNIFKAKTFVDTQGRWWNASQILYITAS